MRPKKVILCVYENDRDLSLMRFLLATKGYRVLSASNCLEAIEILRTEYQINLVVIDMNMQQMPAVKLVAALKQTTPQVAMLLLGEKNNLGGFHVADAMLAKSDTPTEELMERIRIMSIRKRGPKRRGRPMEIARPAVVAVA